ncbi:MAG: catalase [Pseudomonadota bacterium]
MFRPTTIAICLSLVAPSAFADGQTSTEENMAAFERLFGVTKGKRRNHTKGFCIVGEFLPKDPAIRKYSKSPIFAGKSAVNGRVSHKGGKANPPDNKPANYGLAFEITTPENDSHIINMNTEHFFPVSTTEKFIELLRAKAKGKEATKAFAKSSPELKAYKAYHSALDKSLRPYEGATYNSINTFYLVDDAGKKTAVRWSFIPTGQHELVLPPSESFFLENMQANLKKGAVTWDMVVSIAEDGDDILNPAIKWSDSNTKIVAASLKVTSAVRESDGVCDEMNFDPTLLSEGFEPSEDPMLQARSDIYALGVGRRTAEK